MIFALVFGAFGWAAAAVMLRKEIRSYWQGRLDELDLWLGAAERGDILFVRALDEWHDSENFYRLNTRKTG